jgi:putative transcriptional regulator
LEKGLEGRRLRWLRQRLGLSQAEFAERYSIPVANIRQYEIGRTMPPPAVRAYLKVILEEPEITAAALKKSVG